jgi:hypothetical protein
MRQELQRMDCLLDPTIHSVEVSGDLIEDSEGEMRTVIDDP